MARPAERLRLLALPLTRSPRLTYFLAHRIRADAAGGGGAARAPARLEPLWARSITRATTFGDRQWQKLGKARPGTWTHKLYVRARACAPLTPQALADANRERVGYAKCTYAKCLLALDDSDSACEWLADAADGGYGVRRS